MFIMAHMNNRFANSFIENNLVNAYCTRLTIKEQLNEENESSNFVNYLPNCVSKKNNDLNVIDYSRMPALEKLNHDVPNDPQFGCTSLQVHPKKKLRLAYSEEIKRRANLSVLSPTKEANSIHHHASNLLTVNDKLHHLPTSFKDCEVSILDETQINYGRHHHPFSDVRLESPTRKSQTNIPELIPKNILPYRTSAFFTPPRSSFPKYTLPGLEGHLRHRQSDVYNSGFRPYTKEIVTIEEKPQDLRVSYSERLKNVARDILNSPNIPHLNYKEIIPQIISTTQYPKRGSTSENEAYVGESDDYCMANNMEGEYFGRKMSLDAMHHDHHRHSRDKSPAFGNSCSPNCYDQYPPSSHLGNSITQPFSSPTARKKDINWLDRDGQSHIENEVNKNQRTSTPNISNSESKRDDPEGYLRKPIEEWSYADVIFFLMDACKELRINPGEVKFKNSDNGSLLLRMSPNDFEVLAPNHGQKLHDHFINFKTQNYMVSERHNVRSPYGCNSQYASHPNLHRDYSPQDDSHHHNHHPNGSMYPHSNYQQDHRHHDHRRYPEFQGNTSHSSSYHSSFQSDSPSHEYVPQGSQYRGDNPLHLEMTQRKIPDLPSAAGKIFPPLHNHDEPLSDPDDVDEDLPPEPPKKRGPGRPPKPENERKRKTKKTGRLWEFIRNLLLDPKTCPSLLRWEDAQEGVFRIVQSDAIANKWGMRKNNEKMNYEKLSRAMRYYYKAKIFEPVLGKRLVYKFGSNAKGWRPINPNNPNFQNSY